MNPPPGMIPRIPAQTGRLTFGKLFLWRLQLGLSQSAVILDTLFDSIAPEQPCFYASINELHRMAAETFRSKTTLLKAREELIRNELIILVNRSDDIRGNKPALYWRFMPEWAAVKPVGCAKIEKSRINCTTPSPEFVLPFRGKIANFEAADLQNREEENRRRGEREAVPPIVVSNALRISLEHRISELREEILKALRRKDHERLHLLYSELATHQRQLGFTPDKEPKIGPDELQSIRTIQLPAPDDERLRNAGTRQLRDFMKRMRGELPHEEDLAEGENAPASP